MNFGGDGAPRALKDIWGCGQGIGAINKVQTVGEFIAQLRREYEKARKRFCA
jgi:nitronate monooxygenase